MPRRLNATVSLCPIWIRQANAWQFPFEGHELYGNLRKPVGADNPPVVIMVPGLEATKEEIIRLYASAAGAG